MELIPIPTSALERPEEPDHPLTAFHRALERPDLSAHAETQMLNFIHALSPHLGLDPEYRTLKPDEVADGLLCLMENGFEHSTKVGPAIPWTEWDQSYLPRDHENVVHREEWLRQEIQLVSCADPAKKVFEECDGDGTSVTFYHGTTALVARLLQSSGGFIPGPNGHTKAKKHYKG